MQAIWTPAVLLFLVSVAILIAFPLTTEMLADLKRARRPVLERESTTPTMRHLPEESRQTWRHSRRAAEGIRRVAPD